MKFIERLIYYRVIHSVYGRIILSIECQADCKGEIVFQIFHEIEKTKSFYIHIQTLMSVINLAEGKTQKVPKIFLQIFV